MAKINKILGIKTKKSRKKIQKNSKNSGKIPKIPEKFKKFKRLDEGQRLHKQCFYALILHIQIGSQVVRY